MEFKLAEIGNVSRCHANKSHKADGIMSVINTVKKSVILSGIELNICPEQGVKEEFHESMITGKATGRELKF